MGNHFRTWILLGTLSAIFIGIGGMLGRPYMVMFALVALALNFGSYWFSDRMVLAIHRAREIPVGDLPELHSMVAELAQRAGIPKPRVYLVEDEQPNAFATGRNPEKGVVAVTTGLLRRMPPRELRGILAHEIGHILNRDTLIGTVAATVAGAISYAAQALSFATLFGGHSSEEENHSGGLIAMLVAPIAGFLLQMAISRSREYLADETAAKLTGDPEALASALRHLERDAEKVPPMQMQPATASLYIINPFAGGQTIASLFSTHPPTSKRIARLEAMNRSDNSPLRAA